MDATQFDHLLHTLATSPSRREALRLVVGAALGGLLASDLLSTGARARHRRAKKRRQRRRRGRNVCAEIVGGTPVPEGTYSFGTFIRVDAVSQCTGSLIAPSFVLTAAHCVEDGDGVLHPPGLFTLIVGRVSTLYPPDANLRGVAAVFQHPGWDRATLRNDVAVLRLSEPVPADVAQPAALVGVNDTRFDTPGQAAVTIGWGRTTGSGPASTQLYEAPLAVISDADCALSYPGGLNPDVDLCAASPGASVCFGDSGGPLFVPQVGGAARADETEAERKKHKKHKKRKKRKKQTPPPPPPPPVIQFGITNGVHSGCPAGGACIFTQLSAPDIRNFVASVTGM